MFDVSIVLNLHRDGPYLTRTLRSLEQAVAFAKRYDVRFELVVVLDRPDAITAGWIGRYDFRGFDGHRLVVVDHGSLGPSRNAGITASRGQYIATADGDDLVSPTMFAGCLLAARSRGLNAIAMPQYLYAFGDRYHLVRYYGSAHVSRLGFFSYNPCTSRIFCHRSVFDRIQYQDARLGSGFAYEDWQFNCEAMASGFEFVSAYGTVLFYRQRAGSLLRAADSASSKVIGWTPYFEPANFVALCAPDFDTLENSNWPVPDKEAVRLDFGGNRDCVDSLIAANAIDPAIDPVRIPLIETFTNIGDQLDGGRSYYQACERIGDRRFTDIVLLPFLTTGGGDKYMLDLMNGLTSLDTSRRFLILAGEPIDRHQWLDKLPNGSLFLDLYQLCHKNKPETVDLVTLRLIQAMGRSATLYMKSSIYSVRFFRKFGRLLDLADIVYLRFSDAIATFAAKSLYRGFNFDFMSEYGSHLTRIITDNRQIADFDRARLDLLNGKIATLYARCDLNVTDADASRSAAPTYRLLWASRLDPEKRPEMLLRIARGLANSDPRIVIVVYGAVVMGDFDVASLEGLPNVHYEGPYSGFEAIPHDGFDAFLYTSAFDGLPNVILEAMSCGLPVIAPDVGGIGEAVSVSTGFLIDSSTDDDAVVARYLEAIGMLYGDDTDRAALGRNAITLIASRHSQAAYLSRLSQIFPHRFEALQTGAVEMLPPDSDRRAILSDAGNRNEKQPATRERAGNRS